VTNSGKVSSRDSHPVGLFVETFGTETVPVAGAGVFAEFCVALTARPALPWNSAGRGLVWLGSGQVEHGHGRRRPATPVAVAYVDQAGAILQMAFA